MTNTSANTITDYFPGWVFSLEPRQRHWPSILVSDKVVSSDTVPQIGMRALQSEADQSRVVEALRTRGLSAVTFEVDPDVLLTRHVSVPKKAAKNAAQILQLDLKQNTPLDPSAVDWSLGPWRRDGERLTATQYVMKRVDRDRLARVAHLAGIKRFRILPAVRPVVPPIFETEAPSHRSPVFWAAASALLCLAALGIWYQKQYAALADLRSVVADLRTDVETLQAQAASSRASTNAAQSLQADVRPAYDMLQNAHPITTVLQGLTEALDDGIWISELSVDFGEVRLSGLASASALEVVPMIAAQPWARNPRMEGPVVRDGRSGKERFQLGFQIFRDGFGDDDEG